MIVKCSSFTYSQRLSNHSTTWISSPILGQTEGIWQQLAPLVKIAGLSGTAEQIQFHLKWLPATGLGLGAHDLLGPKRQCSTPSCPCPVHAPPWNPLFMWLTRSRRNFCGVHHQVPLDLFSGCIVINMEPHRTLQAQANQTREKAGVGRGEVRRDRMGEEECEEVRSTIRCA